MPTDRILILDDANFEEKVIRGIYEKVLVQFWAAWSPPCRLVSSVVDAIANEFNQKMVVGRLDIDGSPKVTYMYNIRVVPTLMLFDNGVEVHRKTGVVNESTLTYLINRYLEA